MSCAACVRGCIRSVLARHVCAGGGRGGSPPPSEAKGRGGLSALGVDTSSRSSNRSSSISITCQPNTAAATAAAAAAVVATAIVESACFLPLFCPHQRAAALDGPLCLPVVQDNASVQGTADTYSCPLSFCGNLFLVPAAQEQCGVCGGVGCVARVRTRIMPCVGQRDPVLLLVGRFWSFL